ncbi:MAG: tRNA (guanine(26)-N(2))-dimethyltransferase [Halanaeroarchaeum sp.]
MEVTEGTVTVEVPEQSGDERTDEVFFNPDQQLNRDLTIATLRAYRDREPRAKTYFDATAASGVRGVRAAADGWDVEMADVDPDAVELCRANLDRNDLAGVVHYQDANAVLQDAETVFDVTDLDPFGSPIPFADAAFANTRDLVAVTATDTAPLCGAHFESGKRRYSAVPRNTEYHPEMGLRILLSALARTAARYDVGVAPVLSHVSDHYVRTYLDLSHRASDANDAIEAMGHVYHCPECLHREWDRGLTADPPGECVVCGSDQIVTAGPVWLEQTHEPAFVQAVRGELDDTLETTSRADRVLDRLASELDVPMHFDQHRLYKRWTEPAIAMDEFLGTLREAGFEASRTHYGGTTFKTTARVDEIESTVL